MLLKQNAQAAQQNGLAFPGQRYQMISLRVPNAFDINDWSLYGRTLVSIQDQSSSSYASSETAIGDAGLFFVTVFSSTGEERSELRGLVSRMITMGYKQTF